MVELKQKVAAITLIICGLVGLEIQSNFVSTRTSFGKEEPYWINEACTTRADRHALSAASRVLVTGGAGFIGSSLMGALHEQFAPEVVVGLDNFNDYYPQSLKEARAADLERAGVHTVRADLNDAEVINELMSLCHFTHVLHLAAQAGVRYAKKNPMSYVQSNLGGFVTLLEVLKTFDPIPRVVYASSSSVYGLNKKVPFSESDVTDTPASLYAATKKADELLAHTYNNIYGISLTGLRFFTVYGPWGRPDMAAYAFARNIVRGKPVRIFQGPGGTELERDFTFIDDIVKGCLGALDTAAPSIKPAPLRVFNLGNTRPVNVSHFVSTLEGHLGVKAIRDYVPLPATGDVLRTHADVSKAREELGYAPSTTLYEGLGKFVEWFRNYYAEGERPDEVAYVPM